MAIRIPMRHKETGLAKNGFYGFSWTTLLFGFFPALFRGDFAIFVGGFGVSLVAAFVGQGPAMLPVTIAWAFFYNKYYTRKLIEGGYQFDGSDDENARAALALGIVSKQPSTDELAQQTQA